MHCAVSKAIHPSLYHAKLLFFHNVSMDADHIDAYPALLSSISAAAKLHAKPSAKHAAKRAAKRVAHITCAFADIL